MTRGKGLQLRLRYGRETKRGPQNRCLLTDGGALPSRDSLLDPLAPWLMRSAIVCNWHCNSTRAGSKSAIDTCCQCRGPSEKASPGFLPGAWSEQLHHRQSIEPKIGLLTLLFLAEDTVFAFFPSASAMI